MPIYDVEYLDKTGKQHRSTARGESEDIVVAALHAQGHYPLMVRPSKAADSEFDADAVAAEAASKENRLEALSAKVRELQSRFDGGDDSAYDEMLALARLVVGEEAFSDEIRVTWWRQLQVLEGAGSAQGLRERRAFPDSQSSMLIVKGTLVDQGTERTGELHLAEGGLGFRATDLASGTLGDLETLVRFRAVENIRMRGLFKKHMEIVSRDGRSWKMVPDKDTNPAAKQALFRADRLLAIVRHEAAQLV